MCGGSLCPKPWGWPQPRSRELELRRPELGTVTAGFSQTEESCIPVSTRHPCWLDGLGRIASLPFLSFLAAQEAGQPQGRERPLAEGHGPVSARPPEPGCRLCWRGLLRGINRASSKLPLSPIFRLLSVTGDDVTTEMEMSPPRRKSGLVSLWFGCVLVVRGRTHQALGSAGDASSEEGSYPRAVPGFEPTSGSPC